MEAVSEIRSSARARFAPSFISDPPTRPFRVLVAAGSPHLRETIVTLLRRLQVEVVSVRDGAAARDAGAETPFDLLITDVRMPSTDGIELAHALRVTRPELRILFMTVSTPASALSQLLQHPGCAVIQKPFGIQAFWSSLARLQRG